jgi:hypothetical protein
MIQQYYLRHLPLNSLHHFQSSASAIRSSNHFAMTYQECGEASLTTVNTEILPADRTTESVILDDSSIHGDKRGTSVWSKSLVALNETSNKKSRVINSYLGSIKASDETPDMVQTVEADPATSEVKRPEGIALAILTIALMLAVFMMSLDKSIIGKSHFLMKTFQKSSHIDDHKQLRSRR